MSLITITGIAKSHAAQHLFSDVDLQITAGRRVAIVGPNGAGKTTLLELITGEQEADAGTVTRGKDARHRLPPPGGGPVTGPQRRSPRCSPAPARLSGIERRMQHIEAEMAEASADPAAADELAELMDEYGRLQHRFERSAAGRSRRRRAASSPGSASRRPTWTATSASSAVAG